MTSRPAAVGPLYGCWPRTDSHTAPRATSTTAAPSSDSSGELKSNCAAPPGWSAPAGSPPRGDPGRLRLACLVHVASAVHPDPPQVDFARQTLLGFAPQSQGRLRRSPKQKLLSDLDPSSRDMPSRTRGARSAALAPRRTAASGCAGAEAEAGRLRPRLRRREARMAAPPKDQADRGPASAGIVAGD